MPQCFQRHSPGPERAQLLLPGGLFVLAPTSTSSSSGPVSGKEQTPQPRPTGLWLSSRAHGSDRAPEQSLSPSHSPDEESKAQCEGGARPRNGAADGGAQAQVTAPRSPPSPETRSPALWPPVGRGPCQTAWGLGGLSSPRCLGVGDRARSSHSLAHSPQASPALGGALVSPAGGLSSGSS